MTYYAYFASHAPLSTVEMGYHPIRRVHISEIKSEADLHIGDRECIRIYRDDPMLALLDDETGFLILENPQYYGL